MVSAALVTVTVAAGSTYFLGGVSGGADDPWARAELRNASGERIGSVAFADHGPNRHTYVAVTLEEGSGVAASAFHGLHVHANDNPANGTGCVADAQLASSTWFVSADGHLRRATTELHGQHAGDLPSVFVNGDGRTELHFRVDKLTPADVIGRAAVLHAGADNFGNVPTGGASDQYTANSADATTKTQGTGNAGDRVACGVIEGH
jgi:Cu-Zn family superoxide dismutase